MTGHRARSGRSLPAFIVVGAIGFATDALFLQLFAVGLGFNVYVARILSFLPATLVTWLLNRNWSFRVGESSARHKRREYGKYLLVQCCGVAVNFAVFALLVMSIPELARYPVLPLAAGSALGLIVNYTGSRLWVFVVQHASHDKA